MRAQRIERRFERLGLVAAVGWTAPAVLSLAGSLGVYCDLISDETDELGAILAIAGMIGLAFAVGSYLIARAAGRIAGALADIGEISN